MADEIIIDGMPFISSKRASELSGYTQDYIGQLSRGGQIKVRRVGGLWYVFMESLLEYKKQADAYVPEVPVRERVEELESIISFDGKSYISTSKAGKITGYTADYVGQLARAGSIPARQVGNRWYVERERILHHKAEKDALLGAVQAESVGIRRSMEDKMLADINYGGVGPFFEYTKEEGDLIPIIFRERGLTAQKAPKEAVEEEIAGPSEYAIPIRIIEHRAPKTLSQVDKNGPWNVNIQIAKPIWKSLKVFYLPIVITIVVVLSIGFFSLKNSSIYTQNDNKNGEAIQVAAVGNVLDTKKGSNSQTRMVLDSIAGFLEQLLTDELVFHR